MKKARFLFITVFAFLLISCSKQPVKVACVGDSITEGFGLVVQSRTAYPAVLGHLLGTDYRVLNFGRSATTMNKNGDFPYWIAKEFSNVFAESPDIIVIKLGTNDTKPQNWKSIDYIRSYQAMIDTFKTMGSHPKIYLCYPVPVYEDRWGINDSTVIAGVIPAIDTLAAKNNLPIIDLYKGMLNQPGNFPDGVHPDEKGAAIMAKLVAEAIKN